ncbi:MAG: hypothetical protein IJZ59_02180 [Alphaproteobacteria bacterium]|nr:hypothetical protein [Alphaproteobacteria bacterium]
MVSKEVLYSDIESICKYTNAIYGCYNDLHEFGPNGEATKLPEFIEKAKSLMGDNASHYLYQAGIIRQQLGGDYDFNFPFEVMAGGGMCYDQIGSEDNFDYRLAFFFDDKTDDDYYNIYHELGHLMQFEQKLFQAKEINWLYKFLSKGISEKGMPKSKMAKLFVDSFAYQDHLLEVHANSFATACMILRAENEKERKKQSWDCYFRSAGTFFEGLKDSEKKYPGMKYYSNLPLQKHVIKEVNRWYKSGEISQYKDENGNINFCKVALKTRDLVLKYSYSPRTFKQFLDMDFFAHHPSYEKGWRHSIPEALIVGAIRKIHNPDYQSQIERSNYHEQLDLSRQYQVFKPLPENDEAAKLINICCQLDDAFVNLSNGFGALDIQIGDYDELDLDKLIKYGSFPHSVIKTLSNKIAKEGKTDEETASTLLLEYKEITDKLLATDYDKEKICNIMNAMNQPVHRNVIWEMYYSRRTNDDTQVDITSVQLPLQEETKRSIQKAEFQLIKDIRKIIVNEIFEEGTPIETSKQHKLMQSIIETMSSEPKKLEQSDFAEKLLQNLTTNEKLQEKIKLSLIESLDKIHTLYFMDTQIFSQAISKHKKALEHYIGDEKKKNEIKIPTKSLKNNNR